MEALLAEMVGPIEQVPPVHSAIKIGGTPLYERARRGEVVVPPARTVTINELKLIDWDPPVLTVDLDCSKGFYVRSFARDLGHRAGSCAYLSNLIRTRVASFTLCDAWTMFELAGAPLIDEWETVAIAPDAPALRLPAVVIEREWVADWHSGKRWMVDAAAGDGSVRVYDSGGNWLGIGELTHGASGTVLHPRKVIPFAVAALEDCIQ
jgi:tRNA pseudouridine55 synthase